MSVVRMSRLTGLLLDRHAPSVLAELAALGQAELLAPQTVPEWSAGGLTAVDVAALLPRVTSLGKRAAELAEGLDIAPDDASPLRLLTSDADLDDAEAHLVAGEAELARLVAKLEGVEGQARSRTAVRQILDVLAETRTSAADVRRLTVLTLIHVELASESLPRLELALGDRPVFLRPLVQEAGRASALLVYPRAEEETVAAALTTLLARCTELPAEVDGDAAEAARRVEDELAACDIDRRRCLIEREEVALRHRRVLSAMTYHLQATRVVLEMQRQCGRSGRMLLFSAWIPTEHAAEAVGVAERLTAGACVVRVEDAPVGANTGLPPVPTRLRNPSTLRPFEALVEMYGRPAYGETDPTPIVALSFVVMFGMMFGDVGQGAVLLLLGYLAAWKVPKLYDSTVILRLCALSSVVFGCLYGDLFGYHFMEPIYLKPMSDTMRFLMHTAVFGVGFMTLGLALNLANAIRTRDFGDLLFGKNGIAGIWFYWGTLVAFVILGVKVSWIPVVLIWIVPMVLLFFREPLAHAIARRKHLIEGGKGEFVVGAFFELFETVIGYLSNTISFVRLAAFALNHAGLFTVVFLLAKMANGGSMDRWVDAIIIVLGNVFIIGLEGLVVTIQSLRLEYYEFFSKFYRGTGTPFQPVKLPSGGQRT